MQKKVQGPVRASVANLFAQSNLRTVKFAARAEQVSTFKEDVLRLCSASLSEGSNETVQQNG